MVWGSDPNYYRDLSQRMKNPELDLVIVVNMFLTGFDAPTLNTLYVDKNLRRHGLQSVARDYKYKPQVDEVVVRIRCIKTAKQC